MWLNKIDIIQIGNSKGIRIPKVILEQCHIKKSVDLEVKNDKIIIMPHSGKPRKNWAQAFEKMAKNKDDKLLIDDALGLNRRGMAMVIKQYDIFLISLDPAIGREIKKSRPCVIISPEEMNTHIGTVIIAPMTTKSHHYPTRIPIKFANKNGWIVLDQIRTIDKERIIKKLGNANSNTIKNIKSVLQEMLVD